MRSILLYYLGVLLLLLANEGFAQENAAEPTRYTRRISFQDWLEEMANYRDSVYQLENVEIYYRDDADNLFDNEKKVTKHYTINADVILLNCHINTDTTPFFKYITFNKSLILQSIEGLRHFNFLHCDFNGALGFFGCTLNEVRLDKCNIRGNFILQENKIHEAMEIDECTIDYKNSINPYAIRHLIDQEDFTEQDSSQFFFLLNEKFDFYVKKTKFLPTRLPNPIISFMDNEFTEIQIDSCDIARPIDFLDVEVENLFVIRECRFDSLHSKLSFEATSFPDENTNIVFDQIQGRLAIFMEYTNYVYTARKPEELTDKYKYAYMELINIYNQIETIYQQRGDGDSFNKCYVEKKDLETRMLKYQYELKPDIKAYFDWQMNIFLKFFCSYGTDPVRSLVISFYVILLFALFYFVFPSEEDNLTRDRFVRNIKECMIYFQSDAEVAYKHLEDKIIETEHLEEEKTRLLEPRKSIPSFIYFIGSPLYYIYLEYYEVSLWLRHRMNMKAGIWEQLSPRRKVLTFLIMGGYITFFILWGFLMRVFNALALSLNAFVTLGYGEIEAKGISRYLAVLEGAMGWFLLSIFSVSLISQILQ